MRKVLISILSVLFCLCMVMAVGCSTKENKLYLYETDVSLDIDKTYKIAVEYEGDEIEFKSLDEAILEVSNDGTITPIKAGQAFIEVAVGDITKTLLVEIFDVQYSVNLSLSNISIVKGSQVEIVAQVYRGDELTSESVTWSVSSSNLNLTVNGNNAIISSNSCDYYTVKATFKEFEQECEIKVVNSSATKLGSPALTLEGCNTVNWSAIDGADAYLVRIDNGKWQEIEDTSFSVANISDNLKCGESVSVFVKARSKTNFDYIDSALTSIIVAHDYVEEEIEEYDCNVAGTVKFKCSNCEKEYILEEYTQSHQFVEGICVHCGKLQTEGIVYRYDEERDSYYVHDVTSAFSDEYAFVASKYDDGVNGEKPVTRIGPSAFLSSIDVKRIYLPSTVTKIEYDAFRECLNLELISMPGVQELDESLKYNAQGVATYGGNFFLGCTALKYAIVPSGFKLRTNAFSSFYAKDYVPQLDFYALGTEAITAKWQENSNDLISGVAYYYDETGNMCGSWRYDSDGEIVVNYPHSYVTDKQNAIIKCSKCGVYENYGVKYSFDTDHYAISGYTGADPEVKVLDYYDDGIHGRYPVTEVSDEAFNVNTFIEKIVLPESVTKIGRLAFRSCSNLKYISMVGVKELTYQNLNWSKNVKTLIVAPSLKVSPNVFNLAEGDTERTDIYVMGTSGAPIVDSLMNPMLYGNENVYFLDDTLVSCMSWRFNEDGDIEKNTTKHNYIDSKCENCGAFDALGVKYSFDTDHYLVSGVETGVSVIKALSRYNDGKNGEYPVTEVSASAFTGNTTITKVVLPESITTLGHRAFANCTSLEYVSIIGVKELGHAKEIFNGCNGLSTLIIGTQFTAGEYNFKSSSTSKANILVYGTACELTIKITSGQPTFNALVDGSVVYYYNEDGVTAGTWKYDEDGVKLVPKEESPEAYDDLGIVYTFDTNRYIVSGADAGLTEVIVLAEYCDGINGVHPVTEIAASAFENSSSKTTITKVILPNSVVTIGSRAFAGCTALAYVEMPGVTALTYQNFVWTNALETIVIGTELSVADHVFTRAIDKELNVLVYGTSVNLSINAGTYAESTNNYNPIKTASIYYYNEAGGENTWKYVDGIATINE